MRRYIVHFATKARWIQCVSVTIILSTILGYDVKLTRLDVFILEQHEIKEQKVDV